PQVFEGLLDEPGVVPFEQELPGLSTEHLFHAISAEILGRAVEMRDPTAQIEDDHRRAQVLDDRGRYRIRGENRRLLSDDFSLHAAPLSGRGTVMRTSSRNTASTPAPDLALVTYTAIPLFAILLISSSETVHSARRSALFSASATGSGPIA